MSDDDDRLIASGLYLARIYEPKGAASRAERALLALARRCDWFAVLARNLAIAGALSYATERVGSGRYCRVCDEPTPRESWERTVDGCPACWRRG